MTKAVERIRETLTRAMAAKKLRPHDLCRQMGRDTNCLAPFLNGIASGLDEKGAIFLERALGLAAGELSKSEAEIDQEFRAYMAEKTQHWTRAGTFKLITKRDAGGYYFELWIDDEKLDDLAYADLAGERIAEGRYDSKLREPGSALNVPLSRVDWNGLS